MANEGISSLMIRKYRILDGEDFRTNFKWSISIAMLMGASMISTMYTGGLLIIWKQAGLQHFGLTMGFVGSLVVVLLSSLLLEMNRKKLSSPPEEP